MSRKADYFWACLVTARKLCLTWTHGRLPKAYFPQDSETTTMFESTQMSEHLVLPYIGHSRLYFGPLPSPLAIAPPTGLFSEVADLMAVSMSNAPSRVLHNGQTPATARRLVLGKVACRKDVQGMGRATAIYNKLSLCSSGSHRRSCQTSLQLQTGLVREACSRQDRASPQTACVRKLAHKESRNTLSSPEDCCTMKAYSSACASATTTVHPA